ncbi:hypothetical protein [Saccharopolyspora spinosa]|uniref:hypothetical protein n=1 Tax=Saccharopolyspora spinosa TaxID=60894 RepID=UPI0030842B0C
MSTVEAVAPPPYGNGAAAQGGDKVRGASSHQGPWPTLSSWHGRHGHGQPVDAGTSDGQCGQARRIPAGRQHLHRPAPGPVPGPLAEPGAGQ